MLAKYVEIGFILRQYRTLEVELFDKDTKDDGDNTSNYHFLLERLSLFFPDCSLNSEAIDKRKK